MAVWQRGRSLGHRLSPITRKHTAVISLWRALRKCAAKLSSRQCWFMGIAWIFITSAANLQINYE